jgi:hypothetical protein
VPSLEDLQEYAASISETLAPGVGPPGEGDEFGQPQEAAVWDLLRTVFVDGAAAAGGAFVEVRGPATLCVASHY